MDFKDFFYNLFASLIIVARRFILLILTPYKTMRTISQEKDFEQIMIIIFFALFYFYLSSFLRHGSVSFIFSFIIFLANFNLMILFFYFVSSILIKAVSLSSFIFTFYYSLAPTLIWFSVSSFLYYVLPPPRTASLLGQLFSVFYITLSLSLLFWKLILVYLALRFASKQSFYRIIYFLLLYLLILIPFSFLMYYFKIFRVPFI